MQKELSFSLVLNQLELAVRLRQLSPQQAIEQACEAARALGLADEIIDALKEKDNSQ